MRIIETAEAAHHHSRARATQAVLVPTMGALHRGHAELIRVAHERAGVDGEVVVSIFVNPLQFEPGSDFDKYPRPQEADEQICRAAGVDLLFRPRANEMYFDDGSVFVEETKLSRGLCGASRPGHFRGVCTVVTKLFHLLAPDTAVFGEKDFQQLAIMRRIVRDLNFSIEIVGVPTVRESDGLALSSRNRYLDESGRAEATILSRALEQAKELVARGECSAARLIASAVEMIASAKSSRVDYIGIVDGETLEPTEVVRPDARMLLAVFIGTTRLIDNIRLA